MQKNDPKLPTFSKPTKLELTDVRTPFIIKSQSRRGQKTKFEGQFKKMAQLYGNRNVFFTSELPQNDEAVRAPEPTNFYNTQEIDSAPFAPEASKKESRG